MNDKGEIDFYLILGLITGMFLSSLSPFNFNTIFGKSTILSIVLALLLTMAIFLAIVIPIIRYYKKLEN